MIFYSVGLALYAVVPGLILVIYAQINVSLVGLWLAVVAQLPDWYVELEEKKENYAGSAVPHGGSLLSPCVVLNV